MIRKHHSGLVCVLFSLALSSSSVVSAQAYDPAAQSRKYFEYLKDSTSLQFDWQTIVSFVAHAKGPVLADLIAAYKKPPSRPQAELKNLLASGIRLHYVSEFTIHGGKIDRDDADLLMEFVSKDCQRPVDAWAAYNSFRALVSGDRSFIDPVLEQMTAAESSLLRSAAMEAVGRRGDNDLLEKLTAAIKSALKEEDRNTRALLVESAVWGMANTCAISRARKNSAKRELPSKKTSKPKISRSDVKRLRPLVKLLSHEALLPRTHRQIEIALQHGLGVRKGTKAWNRILLGDEKPKDPSKPKGRTVVAPPVRFMGLESSGERIVFVLDASDSMLKPLKSSELETLRELIEKDNQKDAKEHEPADEPKGKKKGRTVVKRPSRVDKALTTNWDLVKTRFDAARAHLKHTLSKMNSSNTFAIVLFGNKAELLKITPKFVKASDKARLLVARELDAIKAGPKGKRFPFGQLRGKTNLYAAFDLAFRVTTRGVLKSDDSYADRNLMTNGCDALFVLSDGQPTVDGLPGRGPLIESKGYWVEATPPSEIEITDPETGAKRRVKVPGSPRRFVPPAKYRSEYEQGPFTQTEPLIDDVRRRNLFLRAAIHVVGIGEANYGLLKRLAKTGHGRWIQIGEEFNGPDGPIFRSVRDDASE